MNPRTVKVFAPATIGNVGSGFDVIGIAIDRPGDVVVALRTKRPGLDFILQNKGGEDIPADPAKNVAGHVAQLLMDDAKPQFGVKLILYKRMPVGSGLGSSAASSVGAVLAVNALMTRQLKRIDLLRFALEGERLATGSAHADNAAPFLLGGAQLVRSYDPLDVIRLPVRNTIRWVVAHPHIVLHTHDARDVLPKEIVLSSAIRQWGNVGGLVTGLSRGDAALVGRCTEDAVVEPHRAKLVPGFYEVKQSALDAGAPGCTFSGSGPSMFAVAASSLSARKIAFAMRSAFARTANVKCDIIISNINMRGAVLL